MPITLQEYRAKQQQISMPAIRMSLTLGPVRDKILALQEQGTEEAKKAKAMMDEFYASNGYMIATAPNTTEERFNEVAKGLDLLPELLDMKVPGEPDRTMKDVLLEGKSDEEKVKTMQDIFAYGQLVGIERYMPVDELKKKNVEKALKQQKEDKLYKENRNRPIPEFSKEDTAGDKRTAAEWIDDFREFGGISKQNVAEIMAARLLANSIRDVKLSKTGLQDAELTRTQIIKTANMLKESAAFDSFWMTKQKGIKEAYGKGHGGGLDDLFKEAIRKMPAGTLPEEGVFSRYMPTALERIDELKNQIKSNYKALELAHLASEAAAEIVILRNMVGAEKGQKNTLNKKLTVQQMNELKGQVKTLASDPTFREMLKDPKVQSLMTKGHGGDMLERMRELQKKYPNMNPNTKNLMNGSTIGNHITDARKKAADIAADIRKELEKIKDASGKRNMDPIYTRMNEAKEVLAEYMALDNQARKSASREEGLMRDVPTEKINEQVKNRDKNEVFNQVMKNLSPAKAIEIMDNVSSKEPDEFLKSLSKENLDAILPEEKDEVREHEKGSNLDGPAMIINNF